MKRIAAALLLVLIPASAFAHGWYVIYDHRCMRAKTAATLFQNPNMLNPFAMQQALINTGKYPRVRLSAYGDPVTGGGAIAVEPYHHDASGKLISTENDDFFTTRGFCSEIRSALRQQKRYRQHLREK